MCRVCVTCTTGGVFTPVGVPSGVEGLSLLCLCTPPAALARPAASDALSGLQRVLVGWVFLEGVRPDSPLQSDTL